MGFALTTIGLLMIVVGAKGTHKEFGAQLVSDFTGPNNFMYWLAALGTVGALGYVQSMRALSHAFLALIIIAIFLSNDGFFAKLQDAMKQGPVAPPKAANAPGNASPNTGILGGFNPSIIPGSPIDAVRKLFGF